MAFRSSDRTILLSSLVFCVSLAHSPGWITAQAPQKRNPPPTEAVRQLSDIHSELRQFERETAQAKTDAERVRNLLQLCGLFVEIARHPDLPRSPTLQSLSVRLRARLLGLERRISTELTRRQIPQPPEMTEREKTFRRSRVSPVPGSQRAASYLNRPATSRQSYREHPTNSSASSERIHPNNSSARSASDVPPGSANGDRTTPAKSKDQPGLAGPGGLPDYGWILVDLIRKTVRPDYWDVAGGQGKAIYFGHSRAIVIHGSWRVQEDVAQLLNALRGG